MRLSLTTSPQGSSTLNVLTSMALALPGMVLTPAVAADTDSIGVQYSYYQESERTLVDTPNALEPLTVETLRFKADLGSTERLRLGFEFAQDVWSGATPVATAPLVAAGNRPVRFGDVQAGASPMLNGTVLLDNALKPLAKDPTTGQALGQDARLVHILASASPEVRQQGNVNLGFEGDEGALTAQVGVSQEPDYESWSVGIGARRDFSQKQTVIQGGISYARSEISAVLDRDAAPYVTKTDFLDQLSFPSGSELLQGVREEVSATLSLTQILTKRAWLQGSLGYSRTSGLLENPYKAVTVLFVNPGTLGDTVINADRRALLEQRPDVRNQWTLGLQHAYYLPAWDAALRLDYHYSRDDWGIAAHSLEAQWIQPLGAGWTIAPRLRYYSQEAADFYQPYLVSLQNFREPVADALGREVWVDSQGAQYFRDAQGNLHTGDGALVDADAVNARPQTRPFDRSQLPAHFSSDHRLSGFGALSGGLTLSKEFLRGLSVQADLEYYTHAGGLKLGGDGEGDYSDFHAWGANLTLKVDLDAPLDFTSTPGGHAHAGHGTSPPAGVQFAHLLPEGMPFMLGYQMRSSRAAGMMLHDAHAAADTVIVAEGCGAVGCRFVPNAMTMTMQMVELMFAATDSIQLMLMPQFMSMDMELQALEGRPPPAPGIHEHTGTGHTTGGLGDTLVAALVKLHESPGQQVHFGLGLSVPTGAVDERFRRVAGEDGGLVHFDMQLGSGTWDLVPSLTYSGEQGDWSWGAQLRGALRLGERNQSGYRLGDVWEATAWGGVKLDDGLQLTLRGSYTAQGAIVGDFNEFNGHAGPMDFPENSGGRFWDVGLGVDALIPAGLLAGHSLRLEWLQPVRDDGNGFQLEREGTLVFSWSYAF